MGGYIKNKYSKGALRAYNKGLLPISKITKKHLTDEGWENSREFFLYLCRKNYVIAKEYHHTTFMYKNTKFYDVQSSVKHANENYDLASLKKVYLKKATMKEVLEERGVQYVTVLLSRTLMHTKNDKCFDCIQFNGFYWWSFNMCISIDSEKVIFVKYHKFGEANLWYNKNKRKIERQIFLRKKLTAKPQK
jgi:hypothetical protein